MADLGKHWQGGKGICADLIKRGVKKDQLVLYGDEGGKRVKLFDQQCAMLDKIAASGEEKELRAVTALAAAATANSMALLRDMKGMTAYLAQSKKDKDKDLAEDVAALERSFATFSREATAMTDKFKKLVAATELKVKGKG